MTDLLLYIFAGVVALTFATAVVLGFAQARGCTPGDLIVGCLAALAISVFFLLPAFALAPESTESNADLAATRLLYLPGAAALHVAVGCGGAALLSKTKRLD